MFRSLTLPSPNPGKLYLHSMPGGYEELSQSAREIQALSVDRIISLAPLDEIQQKSPTYAKAIKSNNLPCEYTSHPITDYGVPEDRREFVNVVEGAAKRLQSAERILVHCGAGIGRTGTFSCCVLIALGLSQEEAEETTKNAASHPETTEQRELVHWYAQMQMNTGSDVQ